MVGALRSHSSSFGQRLCTGERTIVSDVLPDIFRKSNVQRLAPFFRAQREALASLSQRDHPRIVLLTPGPRNETYFEHSYIARYLGFTLVAGADLTVRDRAVYLKTVDGLERIDVSCAAWMIAFAILSNCAAIHFSVYRAWSDAIVAGMSSSPMHWEAA